jgi:hypothetical protein
LRPTGRTEDPVSLPEKDQASKSHDCQGLHYRMVHPEQINEDPQHQ